MLTGWPLRAARMPGSTSSADWPCGTATGLPPEIRMRSAQMPMRVFLLRHKSDTIDLLEIGFSGLHELHRGIAQGLGAGFARRLFQLARRRARDDELAQLVVEHQQLADGFSSLEAGSAAFAATARMTGFAVHPHQALRE